MANPEVNTARTAETTSVEEVLSPSTQKGQMDDLIGGGTAASSSTSNTDIFADTEEEEDSNAEVSEEEEDDTENDEETDDSEDDSEDEDEDDSSTDEDEDEEAPDDEITRLRQTVARLTEAMNGGASGPSTVANNGKVTPQGEVPVNAAPPPANTATSPAEPFSFVNQERLVKALRSPEELNKLLNEVVAFTEERLLRTVPQIVDTSTSRQIAIQQAVNNFYSDNSDLLEHKGYVRYKYNELQAADPNQDPITLLTKVADAVRADLGLAKKAAAVESNRRASPAGNGTAKKRRPIQAGKARGTSGDPNSTPTRTGQKRQIDDLIG